LRGVGAGLVILLSTAAGAHSADGADARAVDRVDKRQISRWTPHIREASARFGIPEDWINRVMRAESAGRTTLDGRPITSRAGAMGLMQLMPGTWAEMRTVHRLGPDPHEPRDNILAGTAYLRAMYDRFGYPGLFAAYNAGPARYAEHLVAGRRLPAETVAYAAAVGLTSPLRSAAPRRRSPSSGVLVALSYSRPPLAGQAAHTTPIFVPLSTASMPSTSERGGGR
jgi:soluble lytic murein transglycosylase-like protein